MPRHLTKKQTKYIDELIKTKGITDVEDLNFDQWFDLENMNDFETLYQHINNYIFDKRMAGACDATLKARSTF